MVEDVVEPVEDLDIREISPAVDMDDKNEAFFGTWILSRVHTRKATKYQKAFYLISSDRKMIIGMKAKSGRLIEDRLCLKYDPVLIFSSWSYNGVKQFLNGYTPDYLEVYNAVKTELMRYLDLYDPRHYDLLTLWIIGAYFFSIFDAYPYMYIGGIKRAGKSRCLRTGKYMAFNGALTSDMSPSSLYRLIQNGRCSIFVDENESLNDPSKRQQFRQLILQGYTKDSGLAYRSEKTTSGKIVPVGYEVYSPKMFANISGLDDVLEDRCIAIIMRRSANKDITDVELKGKDPKWQNIRDMLYAFALSHWKEVKSDSDMELIAEGISSRDLELWRPILVLARLFSIRSMSRSISSDGTRSTHSLPNLPNLPNVTYDSLYDLVVDLARDKIEIRHAKEMVDTLPMILTKTLVREVDHDDWYKSVDITNKMKEFLDEKENLKSRSVSNLITRLGFEEKKKIHNRVAYRLTIKSVHDLAKGMGLDVEEILEEKRIEEEEARKKAEEEGEEPTAPVKI